MTISGSSILLQELARIWRALTDGSHRWEIQGSFVCMLTEIIMCLAEGLGGMQPEASPTEATNKAEDSAIKADNEDAKLVGKTKPASRYRYHANKS